jgi:endonuclease/exonuclease/phosphatase family metal-dependent hydrolase
VPRPEDDDLTLGLGLLSRWPIDTLRQVEMPARHRPFGPVTLAATLQHPAGPLHVLVACLMYEPPTTTIGLPRPDQRIDQIFFRPGEWAQRVKVESATVAGSPVGGVYPSDHRAVVCELNWRAGG